MVHAEALCLPMHATAGKLSMEPCRWVHVEAYLSSNSYFGLTNQSQGRLCDSIFSSLCSSCCCALALSLLVLLSFVS